MKCTVTLGYNGAILVDAEDGRSAVFKPGRRTMTGAKHRNGQNRCETASTVKRYLGITGKLKHVKKKIALDDDKGIFNKINAVEIYQNARRCHSIVTVSLTVLSRAAYLLGEKNG